MNTRWTHARPLRAALVAAAIVLPAAACGGGNHPAALRFSKAKPSALTGTRVGNGIGTDKAIGSPAGGPKVAVRFIAVQPPDAGPLDVVEGYDGTGKRLATGLQAGTVTNYLSYAGSGLAIVDRTGKVAVHTGVTAEAGRRYTMVIGADQDGQLAADTMTESNGHILDGDQPYKAGSAKALIVSDGYGLGPVAGKTDSEVRLGTGPRHCVASEQDTDANPNDGGFSLTGGTSPIGFDLDPGAHDLVWLTDVGCRTAETKPVHVTLTAGNDAYALAWFPTEDQLRMLFVPVTQNGPGNQDIVDSGDGPTYAPPNHNTVVDANP